MKCLAVATQNPNAVAETYVRQHMRHIAPGRTVGIGFDCVGRPPKDLPFFCVERNVSYIESKYASLHRFLRAAYSGALDSDEEAKLHAFLVNHNVRTILAEFGPTGAALRNFCKNYKYRLFVNFHGYDATVMPKSWRVRYAYNKLSRDVDGIICGSHYFRNKLIGLGFSGDKIHVIPCGVDLSQFSTKTNLQPGKLVSVGRLTHKKAPNLLLHSFDLALRKKPHLKLYVVGDGPLTNQVNSLIQKLGLNHAVVMRGALPHNEVIKELATAEIFVQHSVTAPNGDQESQGISLLEAMASKLPVVATNHNGFSETVIQGETGLLSQEGDVRGMTENILKLVDNPSVARAYGDAGRLRVERHFSSDITISMLRRVILTGN